VRILAETIASLPLHLYKAGPDGTVIKADNLPEYTLLHDEPNSYQTQLCVARTKRCSSLRFGEIPTVRFSATR
jgi:phage portal protein BeeE